jgi:hypothetical protein
MNEHNYGTHLIKFKADRTFDGNYWIGKAHVLYNHGRILRCFEVHGPAEKFDSKEAAEQHLLGFYAHDDSAGPDYMVQSSGRRGFAIIMECVSPLCRIWFWFGIQKHDKNIYLPCVGWIMLDSAVIMGAIIYKWPEYAPAR